MARTGGFRVLLAGASGLVGGHALQALAAHPAVSEVRVLVRRPIDAPSAKVVVCPVDFERLGERAGLFQVDAVLCALGTTIRKAGSQEAFRRVDFDYPLELARLARAQGAGRFGLVSALGADAGSRIFYSRVKGELEQAVRALGFASLVIARPSVLLGERAEFRLGEELSKRLGWLMPMRMQPVPAPRVAQALVQALLDRRALPGVRVLDNVALLAAQADTASPAETAEG